MSITKQIEQELSARGVTPKDLVLVGVSGGPDSMVLLDSLRRLNQNLIVVHLNYQLRGKDSQLDETLVGNYCLKHDLAVTVKRVKLAGAGIEEKARKIRYEFFTDLLSKTKAKAVLLAHNADDQAETILFNFLRGSFLQGLTGMSAWDEKRRILRPLLSVAKSEILTWATKHKIHFRIDKTNLSTDFTRNFIRHQLIPEIEGRINKQVKATLLANRASWVGLSAFLDEATKSFAKMIEAPTKGEEVVFKRPEFTQLMPFLQIELVKYGIAKVSGDLVGYKRQHFDEILRFLEGESSAWKMLPSKVKISRDSQFIRLAKEK